MQICERKLYFTVTTVFTYLAFKKQMPLIFKDILITGLRKYLSSNQIKKSNNINVKVVDLVQHSSLSTKPGPQKAKLCSGSGNRRSFHNFCPTLHPQQIKHGGFSPAPPSLQGGRCNSQGIPRQSLHLLC